MENTCNRISFSGGKLAAAFSSPVFVSSLAINRILFLQNPKFLFLLSSLFRVFFLLVSNGCCCFYVTIQFQDSQNYEWLTEREKVLCTSKTKSIQVCEVQFFIMVPRVWFFFSEHSKFSCALFFFLNQRSEYMNERLKRRPNYYAIEILFNASILAVLFGTREKKTQKNRDEHTKVSWDKHFDVWRRKYLVQTKRDENIAHTLRLDGKRTAYWWIFLEWCDVDMPLGTLSSMSMWVCQCQCECECVYVTISTSFGLVYLKHCATCKCHALWHSVCTTQYNRIESFAQVYRILITEMRAQHRRTTHRSWPDISHLFKELVSLF